MKVIKGCLDRPYRPATLWSVHGPVFDAEELRKKQAMHGTMLAYYTRTFQHNPSPDVEPHRTRNTAAYS